MSRRLTLDALWVMSGQLVAAVAGLFGMRLLTSLMSPDHFGVMSLSLGIISLVYNIGCAPVTQAAVYFYPTARDQGRDTELRNNLISFLRPILVLVLVVAVSGTVSAMVMGSTYSLLAVVLGLILLCDCIRAVESTLLNASRNHKKYSTWLAGEAWLRPLLATSALLLFGDSALAGLVGYLFASCTMILLLSRSSFAEFSGILTGRNAGENQDMKKQIWVYALPLIPLGLVDWTNGVADRYIIGHTLSLADAGVYAAAYGIASRPFLMLGQVIELAVRPVYQAAVSAGQRSKANKLLQYWFILVCVAGICGVLLLNLWRDDLAALLLGVEYRRGAVLMPWIAAGYVVLSAAQVFQRVCFAHGNSHSVLWIQTTAALVGLAATLVGVHYWGLIGASMAVSATFVVQFVAAFLLSRKNIIV